MAEELGAEERRANHLAAEFPMFVLDPSRIFNQFTILNLLNSIFIFVLSVVFVVDQTDRHV